MNSNEISKVNKFALVIATLSLLLGGISSANAANKTITCYKGTVVKKVTRAVGISVTASVTRVLYPVISASLACLNL